MTARSSFRRVNRRLTQRGKDRKRQLMDYAAQRFAENGYHPTSVAEIVQGMGVGKGVFYWYFSSKEELFLEILRESQTDLRRRQQQAIADVVPESALSEDYVIPSLFDKEVVPRVAKAVAGAARETGVARRKAKVGDDPARNEPV